MIFKVVSRADGGSLARYLLSEKNEQVRVVDLRGTVPNDLSPRGLVAALKDFDELGKITKGQKTIVHLAINPNDNDRMRKDDWEYAIDKAEAALGLSGQPRAVVSHVIKGKEHMHVAWSRVDVDRAVCVQMSHSKLKVVQAAREVELELGLQRTPTRARGENQLRRELKSREQEVQKFQQERAGQTRDQLKADVAAAWHQSKNGAEFQQRLQAVGYRLAQGNRGPLVLDRNNEAYSPARLVEGLKVKDIKAKCADISGDLPTLERARDPRKAMMAPSRARKMVRDELQRQIANDRQQERGTGYEPSL